ncbi:MAG TPA: DNA gyrase modulator, partial [Blastocatellia bacterium]|nr:DNA gyrase modulator [Blastocatellia bacterium]
MTNDAIGFFLSRFGLSVTQIEDLLATALARGGDYADLYFEYRENNSVSLEERIIKTTSRSVAQGVGVRVLAGDKTGYAYTAEISHAAIKQAAVTASFIARAGGAREPLGVNATPSAHDLYAVETPLSSVELGLKIELLKRADGVARGY